MYRIIFDKTKYTLIPDKDNNIVIETEEFMDEFKIVKFKKEDSVTVSPTQLFYDSKKKI